MTALVDGELLYLNFDAVTWLVSAGLAVGLGYIHSYGCVMSKVDGARQSRKTWSNTFTGGVAISAGATFTIILQKGANEGGSETGGWLLRNTTAHPHDPSSPPDPVVPSA